MAKKGWAAGLYPPCDKIECKWNMGNKNKAGYEYLNNTCYLRSDEEKPCDKNKD